MSVETYSLSADFGGTINTPNFLQEIDNAGGITTALIGMRIDGDNVNITFASALSGPEQTTLDGVVSAHIAAQQEVLDEVEYESNATVAPGVSNDTTDKFEQGSLWIDSTADEAYVCLNAGTGAAVWKSITSVTGGVGISSSNVTATTTTSTTSASYVVLDSMTITPTAGTYLAIFSSSGTSSANGADMDYALHLDSTITSHSERVLNYNGATATTGFRTSLHTMAQITANGSQAINVRYRTNAGTFTVYNRSMTLIKVG